MNDNRVVLLVDNKRRDLPGDALIAYNLEKLGIQCFLEPLEAYRGCLAAHRPGMIIFNHLLGSHLVRYSKRLAELGVLVGVLPNEGILYNKDVLRFNAGKYHSGAHIDYFFCWNKFHKEALAETGADKDMSIQVVGPPKFDYYFKPWSEAFNIQGKKPGEKPRVLICTNFVLAKSVPKETDKYFAPWKDRIPAYKDYWKAIESNVNSRSRFFDFLDAIVRSFKYHVTLRPHPGENAAPYIKWHDALDPSLKKGVVLDTGSNITELILSCDIEVSCETCTTALESWIAGKPTIELTFDKHPMFFHENIGALNVLCDNPEDIVSLIEKQLENPAQEAFTEARGRHLENWCASPCGVTSYGIAKIISDALKEREAIDWRRLSLDERRRGAKLKLLSGMDLPYNFDPLQFIKRRLSEKYACKDYIHQKTIRPSDVTKAVSLLTKTAKMRDRFEVSASCLPKNYKIVYITASHKPEVLEQNLLKSKVLEKSELIVQKGYTNISKAYNEADTDADIRVYLHHDVWLPDDFEKDIVNSINEVERIDPNWGVLGVAGVVLTKAGLKRYGFLSDRGVRTGSPENLPHEVDTLDELMLIIKDKDLRFDEKIPSAHFYGADICMRSKLHGKKNYVINAFCHHNSELPKIQEKDLPKDFDVAKDYIRKKYKNALPIATTCTIIKK